MTGVYLDAGYPYGSRNKSKSLESVEVIILLSTIPMYKSIYPSDRIPTPHGL